MEKKTDAPRKIVLKKKNIESTVHKQSQGKSSPVQESTLGVEDTRNPFRKPEDRLVNKERNPYSPRTDASSNQTSQQERRPYQPKTENPSPDQDARDLHKNVPAGNHTEETGNPPREGQWNREKRPGGTSGGNISEEYKRLHSDSRSPSTGGDARKRPTSFGDKTAGGKRPPQAGGKATPSIDLSKKSLRSKQQQYIQKKKKKSTDVPKDQEKDFALQRKKSESFYTPDSITISGPISISDLGRKMNLKSSVLIQKLMNLGYTATINDVLDTDITQILAHEFDCEVEVKTLEDELANLSKTFEIEGGSVERNPIVTVMGHVDHGKTTLLDYIRKTHIADKEHGGITQHIGSYQIEYQGKTITWIDTPGHESFTSMRERGASVTDIIILVVSAEDGVKPQTLEALNQAKQTKVPIIVAITKIDKTSQYVDEIKKRLSELDLIPEEWGGDTMYELVSGVTGEGVPALLSKILLLQEIHAWKSSPYKKGYGFILESALDPNRGSFAKCIVKDGHISVGDFFVVGSHSGRIRSMADYTGKTISVAYPSQPVTILGFQEVPEAGDMIQIVEDEKLAKEIIQKKKAIVQNTKTASLRKDSASLSDIYQQIQHAQSLELPLIVKADTQGTVEAIQQMLLSFSSSVENIRIRFVQCGVGPVTENDVMMASASKAIIIAFQVRLNNLKVADLIEKEHVELRKYNVIYHILEDIQLAMEGMLGKDTHEETLGEALVKEVFKISKIGIVAGCVVSSGKIKANASVRVIRDGTVVHTGKIASIRHFKEEIKEAKKGLECGVLLQNYKNIMENDILECYEDKEVARKLQLK